MCCDRKNKRRINTTRVHVLTHMNLKFEMMPYLDLERLIASAQLARGTFGQVFVMRHDSTWVVKIFFRNNEALILNDGMSRECVALTMLHRHKENHHRTRMLAGRSTIGSSPLPIASIGVAMPRFAMTLKEFLEIRPEWRPSPHTFFSWAVQLRSQLYTIHGAGIVHCDLSLMNVMVRSMTGDEVEIVDYSAANVVGCSARLRHAPWSAKRLMNYRCMEWSRSPEEMCCAPSAHEPPVDVWALGTILLYVWTGQKLNTSNTSVFMSHRSCVEYATFFGVPTAEDWDVGSKSSVFASYRAQAMDGQDMTHRIACMSKRCTSQELKELGAPRGEWTRSQTQSALRIIAGCLQWHPKDRLTFFDSGTDWMIASKHASCDKGPQCSPFTLPSTQGVSHDVILHPLGERFESFFFPRPLPLPIPRKTIIQVMANALFHLTPERHAVVGFDTLLVAVHVLWRWWTLRPCTAPLPLVLGLALIQAESVLGVGHCAPSLEPSIVSFLAYQLNMENPRASESEFEQLFLIYLESVQGRLVDPHALPRLVSASMASDPTLKETFITRDALLVPALIAMLDQEETWIQFGDSSMRLILEQVFVRFVGYMQAKK